MFVAVYWWRVHPGKEEQFREAWRQVTLGITAAWGSFGSRLHQDSDGRFVGYAEWPDRASWQAAFDAGMAHADVEASAMFANAVAESVPDRRPLFTMEVTDDLLTRRSGAAATNE